MRISSGSTRWALTRYRWASVTCATWTSGIGMTPWRPLTSHWRTHDDQSLRASTIAILYSMSWARFHDGASAMSVGFGLVSYHSLTDSRASGVSMVWPSTYI